MAADMKETIAAATRRLIMEKNIKKLTVKDIVEECHITRQAFYYHFEDIPALFRWIFERRGKQILEQALAQDNAEQGLRVFFQMAVNVAPYIKRGMQTNYAEELRQLLLDYCYNFFEQIVERENLYPNSSRADIRLFLRYHSHAIVGLLQDWTDDDTQHLDEIVHKLHLLMNGDILPHQKHRE